MIKVHKLNGTEFVINAELIETLEGGPQTVVSLATGDCIGVEIEGNTLCGGNGRITGGPATPLVMKNNNALPLTTDAPRPKPAVPSIYEWQHTNAKRK